MSTTRYSPVVDDGLIVVPDTAPKDKPYEHSSDNPPEALERNDYPEALPQQNDQKVMIQSKGEGYFAPEQNDPSPPYSNPQNAQTSSAPSQQGRRRICRLPVWGFIALVLAVIIIIILAAVLGGVLGSRKSDTNTIVASNSTSSNSSSPGDTIKPYPAQSGSGIAVVQLDGDSNNPVTYIQDKSNRIIENIWNPGNDSANVFGNSTNSVVATDAKQDTPIVALSYVRNATNLLTRHVIYIDNSNHLKDAFTDSGSNNQWSNGALEATNTETVGSSNAALAACWGDFLANPGQALRLYYGASGDNKVQEMGADLSNDTWDWQYYSNWNDIDEQAGVACNTHGLILDFFYINSTASKLQQAWVDYNNIADGASAGWQYGPQYDQLNTNIAAGTGLAVSYDGQNTETITFQLQDGSIQEVTASLNYNATKYESEMVVANSSAQGSKLASLFVGNGTVLMYQDQDANVITSGWSTNMQPTFNASLPWSA